MKGKKYEVHVESLDESPIESGSLDFYDSGVWVDRDEGRDFFPYGRIEVIRERPAETAEAESEVGVEPRAE